MQLEITDVVLRDGLQDEDVIVDTADKAAIAVALGEAGLRTLEVASFVSPTKVPQMADAAGVMAATRAIPVVRVALALNAKGVHRAVENGADAIQIAVSASNAHSRANAGRDSKRAADELAEAVAAHPATVFIGGVSTAFICPFDGPVPARQLLSVVAQLARLGVARVSLADTIGTAAPEYVAAALGAVQRAHPGLDVGLHLHDAHGQALQTVDLALEQGVRHFDSALGGYGGCPFAPGAHGNIATESLVGHLEARGMDTGVDMAGLSAAHAVLEEALRRAVPVASAVADGR